MFEHPKFEAPTPPEFPTRDEIEAEQDRELRERCVITALQRYPDFDLPTILRQADKLFNYIKTGAK